MNLALIQKVQELNEKINNLENIIRGKNEIKK